MSHHWRQRDGHGTGRLTGGIQVLVVKDGSRSWARRHLSLSVPHVKAIYRIKQRLEQTIKVPKDQLRWGKNPARSQPAHLAHLLHLCLMAFCVLQQQAADQGTTIDRLRRALFRQAIPLHSPLLQPCMDAT
ncbi:MAG: hypothetical protein NZ823_10235 [Blastocatellia bacterium]|nr:hypothetical protein [Blastocatellia bacterium]